MHRTEFPLDYAGPIDWGRFMRFFGKRALDGVEIVEGSTYRRTASIDGIPTLIDVCHTGEATGLDVTVEAHGEIDIAAVTRRLRRSFDLDADLPAIARYLSQDPYMATLVSRHAAVRVPTHWDPFETAMRTVIGQQITVVQAAKLNSRLVERAGAHVDFGPGRPNRLFPTAEQVLAADLSQMGMPGARAATLKAVAEASLAVPELFSKSNRIEDTVERLLKIKGVGPWTAHYIALRACREPDAFPAGDAGLLRGAADLDGLRPTTEQLITRAEPWRPYRAYAAQYLWAESDVT